MSTLAANVPRGERHRFPNRSEAHQPPEMVPGARVRGVPPHIGGADCVRRLRRRRPMTTPALPAESHVTLLFSVVGLGGSGRAFCPLSS